MWKWETEGQARAVAVIIHSAYEHHRRYAWLIENLRTSGIHVISGDLPGHGEDSRHKRVHSEEFKSYETFVKQLMQAALTYNLPVFVVGHGLGAILGIHVVEKFKYECTGVIITSPWMHLKHQPSKLSNALTGLSKLTGNLKINHEINIKHLTRSYEFYKEEKDDIYYNDVITVNWYRELHGFMKGISQQTVFPNIPILLMTGGNDKIADVAYSKKWLAQQSLSEYQYKEWKACYHDLFQEPEREDIYSYMESFIFNTLKSVGYII
ncbi:alpha/beta hydrolase [Viridibacillus arvi]|uniref:Lysophospholipase n=1 Tax=Viridibacillus arvi TaxID=263475 RepID=A0A0M0LPA4_9BACL|nr:alpha/beta hydrolase [Viridibacillus arvi]KOO52533.1 lysophospholipase [Viridibacillus arvi]